MAQTVKKVWGTEVILKNDEHCVKYLFIDPGMQCSLHYHPVKEEEFLVIEGECFIQTSLVADAEPKVFRKGDSRWIPPGLPHRFASLTGAVLVEESTFHDDADVVRLEPSGEIAGVPKVNVLAAGQTSTPTSESGHS